jgi:GNAT superfamily N-acetyltransferase
MTGRDRMASSIARLSVVRRRNSSAIVTSERGGPPDGVAVSELQASEIPQIRRMWSVTAADVVVNLAYDRWGLGIAVPASGHGTEPLSVTSDPRDGVTRMLEYIVHSKSDLCLVARCAGSPIGFVTASVRTVAPNEWMLAELYELFVISGRRRSGIGTELVRQATKACVDLGASTLRVAFDRTSRGTDAFWRVQPGWERDLTVYCRYE